MPETCRAYEEVMEKGVKQGMEKGRAEERKSIAQNMLAEGFALEKAAKLSNLPLAQVRRLAGEMPS